MIYIKRDRVSLRYWFVHGNTTHNSSIRSDEVLTLETSAFECLYGGQFTLSTQLIKPNYLVILPTDAAPQFLQKLTALSICYLYKHNLANI